MSGITINVTGLDELIADFKAISTKGIPRAQREPDDALDKTAEISRDLAHVHEGDLNASQSHSSDHGVTSWQGQVSYGARGATWEMQRGGEHAAFIDALAALTEGDFERAMESAFFTL